MTEPEPEITAEEREGIRMIQFLQRVEGIEESEKDALAGWRAMSEMDKAITRRVYRVLSQPSI